MGVFHMAIPFHSTLGSIPERTPRSLPRLKQGTLRDRQQSQPTEVQSAGNQSGSKPAEAKQAETEPVSVAPVPVTLLAGGREADQRVANPALATARIPVSGSPEKDAEQAALQALVERCRTGEQRAWNELVSCQHRRVYGLCYRFTGDATEAEDVTQDVFIKVYRNLASFDTAKGTFQTWITTLTRNLLVDSYRRQKMDRSTDSLDVSYASDEDGPTRAERLPDTRPSQNQERHVAGLELKVRIQHALKKLSPELREAVILRDLEDMDYKDIAQVLKIPEGTVKSRISRGRAELARLLQNLEGQVM